MKRQLRILDLFSCAGGAAMGYHQAGFEVVGVDINPQPRYPFEHHVGDAIAFALAHGSEFDAIHASPPCQGEGAPAKGTNPARGHVHPRLITPTRTALDSLGVPYVIENVAGSTVRKDLMLCGEMFGLGVLQHRYFELSGTHIPQPVHPRHRGRVRGWRHGVFYDGPYVAAYGNGGGKATIAEMQQAKGITWTDDHRELREAIPPACTEWIGTHLVAALTGREAAA
ncbi:DNA cytosine methyltransferase [Nocardiopsis sp. N85]|uniref:DNA cytosine methyltransferase n=1 Tax=Nocardiopsis sp. N85 TaxID=3029400 RepID=UPI00237EF6BB|nr:DNA cytosine methyltransferase [Nocardiopsis sp. N85]MDE3724512.1 DNA cytosine methyltransferase [Nocardiopsis sp. N85]